MEGEATAKLFLNIILWMKRWSRVKHRKIRGGARMKDRFLIGHLSFILFLEGTIFIFIVNIA